MKTVPSARKQKTRIVLWFLVFALPPTILGMSPAQEALALKKSLDLLRAKNPKNAAHRSNKINWATGQQSTENHKMDLDIHNIAFRLLLSKK